MYLNDGDENKDGASSAANAKALASTLGVPVRDRQRQAAKLLKADQPPKQYKPPKAGKATRARGQIQQPRPSGRR